MLRTLGTILMAGFLLINHAAARVTSNPDSQNRVTVRIWDRSRMESETIDRVKKVVEAVSDPIGIRILWLHCPLDDTAESLACSAPIAPNDISLRIYSRGKADFKVKAHSKGGSSMLLAPEGGKGIIYVFADRVIEVSRIHKTPFELVMGIIVSHEMGHLLLPGQPHSLAGIMHAQLRANDWRLAAQGQLGFTVSQSRLIITGVRARNESVRLASERERLGHRIQC
jgi:hypothetical protein